MHSPPTFSISSATKSRKKSSFRICCKWFANKFVVTEMPCSETLSRYASPDTDSPKLTSNLRKMQTKCQIFSKWCVYRASWVNSAAINVWSCPSSASMTTRVMLRLLCSSLTHFKAFCRVSRRRSKMLSFNRVQTIIASNAKLGMKIAITRIPSGS